ncbi:cytosine permease [Fictibacillus enclensis]|uniref:cytosine permease n=1 Tax=Fictibacillus enclensis TaxID=1017270 RepID=UPI0025A1CCA5|nr:cytosine permease [Fictibacillus enclensis]MDM5340526.1 cytosine permease [Fictibacillus enclensis]
MGMEENLTAQEYENSAVPLKARKSLLSVSLVWFGFPLTLTGPVAGATIVSSLGFLKGMLAIILGSLALFIYVGLLGVLSTKRGYNFSLQSSVTFGKKGSTIVSGLLSTLVIGWFAVQTGMAGSSMEQAFGSNAFLMTLIAGLLFMGLTVLGIKALTYIGAISSILFLVLGTIAASDAISQSSWSSIASFTGNNSLNLGVAITMIIALFADSGTMTADFNRWSKNTKESIIATATAFPLAHMISLMVGGIFAASVLQNTDFFLHISNKEGFFTTAAILLLFCNLGSVCSHCLYNAAVGWSSLLNKKMRGTAFVLGIFGTILALSGAWDYFIQWLNFLGIIVPPIGAVILIDQLVIRRNVDDFVSIRPRALMAWAIGSFIGIFTEFYAPFLSTALIAMIAAGISYAILSMPLSKPININQTN